SDLQGALGTGGTVSARLTTVGTHHITATAADSGGQTRAAAITFTVYAAPPVLTVVSPADGFSTSGSVTLNGTAVDFKDGDRSAAIKWSSSVAGSLGTGATVTAPRLAAGRHVITASVTDSDGLTATKTITIGVGNAPPRVTITQPLDGTSAPAGTPLTFQATAIDGIDGNVTARISWVSDLNGPIGTGGSIATPTQAPGTHRIMASVSDSGGLVGSATVALTVGTGGISFPAVADAYTDANTANQSTNFGTATVLRLWNQPVDRIYLRFNVSGLPAGSVSRAIVRLTTTSAVNAGSDSGGEIHTVSAPWDELTLTHLTKPALDATVLSSVAGPI